MRPPILLAALLLGSCATSRPQPTEPPLLISTLQLDPLDQRTDSLPKSTILQRITTGVFGGRAGKTKSKQKFKRPTTIIIGNNNAGSAATKPGPAATGTGAVATDAKKATAPVIVGDDNQAASSRKGPAVAGDGNQVTASASSNWWKWLLAGTVLGFVIRPLGPWMLNRMLSFYSR